jgi:hypothetical protein
VACSLDFIATLDDRFDWLFSDDDYGFDGLPLGGLHRDGAAYVRHRDQRGRISVPARKRRCVFTRRGESPIPERL